MELLPVELRKTLPPLYSQESCPTPIAHVKLFTPDSSFTWYVTEGEEQEDGDWLLFGLVIGLEEEWGYSLLSEIASARGPLGLPVERDLWFKRVLSVEMRNRIGCCGSLGHAPSLASAGRDCTF